ncbi:hypothetical protein BABINDRAFT_161469 [Babjeviella inositovora NRRL Y-12698]|uniref:Major facilitator superfamily (MFS) profile domain-containing protein n=1 Tax=Babjeviella inositovora NRRL Y-12698 TaxID=984486 RepID=A0A1E3QPY7_9ASCO|nr:uncharacterized protein BABINDRAFT_161469 [Babjeviella inositovora NRRL Y-12698]ODQ79769.1 hypothetical protein BABINDRAFT_161469 [Babjeviella inositovora NRRL Y-12698]
MSDIDKTAINVVSSERHPAAPGKSLSHAGVREISDSDSYERGLPDDGPQYVVYDADTRKHRRENKKISDYLAICCAGFALISDGYQNNVMTMLNKVFAIEYKKTYTASMSTQVSNALLVGAVLGQVTTGLACDYLGRKFAILTATLLIIIGTVLCSGAHGAHGSELGLFWFLTVARGITGFGVGSEYPASSTAASESANETTERRGGVFVLVTNLPLSFGGPLALIIFLIVNKITGVNHHETLWRVMFGIGAVWPISVFYFRWRMATSELYKKSAITKQRVPYWLVLKFYWVRLLGTCGCWFLYDFVTFPNGIFSATIISSVIKDTNDLETIAEWNLLLGSIALPGVIVGAWLCDRIGRKYTLMVGFSGYIVFGLIIGCAYDKILKIVPLFIIFYGLMLSFGNLGPGDMMGLTSSESYATPIRGTCYGFSAAIGKVGAVVGTKVFTPIQIHLGKKWTFIIAAIVGLMGVLLAFFCIPHLDDDDLMMEDIRFQNYLIENGWKGSFGTREDDSTESHDEERDIKHI